MLLIKPVISVTIISGICNVVKFILVCINNMVRYYVLIAQISNVKRAPLLRLVMSEQLHNNTGDDWSKGFK